MHFLKIGKRTINFDNIAHCEAQLWQDATSVKVYFVGTAHNTPLVLSEEEATAFWKYMESISEKPA
jgi:hypothetical protein